MLKPTVLAVLRVAKGSSVKRTRVDFLVANVQTEVVAEIFSKNTTPKDGVLSSVSLLVMPR